VHRALQERVRVVGKQTNVGFSLVDVEKRRAALASAGGASRNT
jgi:hypothetical protein